MIEFRPFLNTDPPEIIRIWRNQPECDRFANSFSQQVFESMVLSKPFFSSDGLIVAAEGKKLLGFVHAGFAPNEEWSDLDVVDGVISLLMVDGAAQVDLVPQLVEHAEAYLVANGSKNICIGSRFPEGPFYLGLFGGSQIPGLLVEHQAELITRLQTVGYEETRKIHIMQRRMGDFRPIINRQQTQVRRNYQIQALMDPQPMSWWESCTLGDTDRTRFLLFDSKTETQVGNVMFWDIHPLSYDWGVRTMGLYDLRVDPEIRHGGLATYLVGESIKHLQQYGINLIEAQVKSDNEPALKLFRKLGFEDVEMGISLVKSV